MVRNQKNSIHGKIEYYRYSILYLVLCCSIVMNCKCICHKTWNKKLDKYSGELPECMRCMHWVPEDKSK